jgi:putative addiction module CopG family antidote
MNVQLTPDQEAFVRDAIASGRLRSADDAIREALALWERQERARAAFRAAVAAGDAEIDRDEGVDFTREELELITREAIAEVHSGKTIDPDVCP